MKSSSWSTVAQIRIHDASAPAGDAVRTAITRTFETVEAPVGAEDSSSTVPADWSFSVDTAGRRFPHGPAPLAPADSGPAIVSLFGDVDAVDRVAAVLGAEFATEQLADGDEATLVLRVHPSIRH